MYWEEDTKPLLPQVTDNVVDLVFALQCRCLPVDHAYALSQAVQEVLPWLKDEPSAGIHSIHVAASSNGWMRPDDPDELLHLSRRTRLMVRVPKHRIDDAHKLEGASINVAGNPMLIKQATVRPLSIITTLFTRHFATTDNLADEEEVLHLIASQLAELDIRPRKMLCGAEHQIGTPDGTIRTRSVMIADLEVDESLRLQAHGVGPHRALGCGLFIPHKHINDVRAESESHK